jgi:hypothetical protein
VPSFGSTSNNPSNGGQGNLQLRGLGLTSTLVLLDGRRITPANGNGVVDVNVTDGTPQAIRWLVETKDYDCGYSMAQKFLQFLYLLFKQQDDLDNSSVKMTLIANYHDVIYDAVPLSETFIWGRPWGLYWGQSNNNLLELKAQPRFKARTFRAIFESTALNNPVGFYGIGFECKTLRPGGRMLDTGKELIE